MADYKRELNLHLLAWRKKNRSHFEIIASMLEAVKDRGTARYFIMKHAGINSSQLKKYLKSLTEIGFIETNIKEDGFYTELARKDLTF